MENEPKFFELKATKSHPSLMENFDMRLALPKPRSIRLNGMSTCVRLERIYWAIFKCIAEKNKTSINVLFSSIDRDVQLNLGGVTNFSSLIRVIAIMQLVKSCPDYVEEAIMEKIE